MAALIDALRLGKSVTAGTLYCTTFPCHMCARHIVAAGIHRVVYIEPYPKSLAVDLYSDSISVDPNKEIETHVNFVPFEGIAPRRFLEWFEKSRRKDAEGRALKWAEAAAVPKLGRVISTYLLVEKKIKIQLHKMLIELELSTNK